MKINITEKKRVSEVRFDGSLLELDGKFTEVAKKVFFE